MPILHPTHTYPALLPRYVSRFACIGPDCEDNCCTGWRVTLDKKTFNAYRQAKHPALSERFTQRLRRQRSQSSDASYAVIELQPDTRECPFMEERLCAVQRALGEDHLSDTCFGYPRFSRNFAGQFEQALTLSCPEAARQALLEPDAFDFVEGSITVRPTSVETIKPKQGMPLELMNEVRIFCLQLMRTEGLMVWQKLAVLGVFCENLTTALTNGGHASVRPMLDSFIAMIESGQALDALDGMQPNHAVQAQVFGIFLHSKKGGHVSAVQKMVQEAVARGLGADAETGQVEAEQLIERYSRGVERLDEALQATPHLLEHYLLNEMFRELFPFSDASPYEHYLRLVSRFGLLRLMLAAQCNTEDALPDAAGLARTVQVFCRRYQHDSNFASRVNTALKNTGWDKLEKVYGFLRA